MSVQWEAGVEFLAEAGLNLATVFDCDQLPEPVRQPLLKSGAPLADYGRLVLLGHGGRRLWEALQAFGMQTADPVDHYSLTMVQQCAERYWDRMAVHVLYPLTKYVVPLTQLGELVGWSQPSPLGQGIHPRFGLWFAYRAAFLTNADLPVTVWETAVSPCDTCAEKPCLTACPAGATHSNTFNVTACADFRLQSGSPCAHQCLARLACPVAPQHRYTEAQIRYHYTHSLSSLHRYLSKA